VAEPTLFGVHNLNMVYELVTLFDKPHGVVLNKCLDGENPAEKFQTSIVVCINKYDTNLGNTERIEEFCQTNKIPFAGRIPFDPEAVKAINNSQSIVDIDCSSGRATKEVFDKTIKILFDGGLTLQVKR
jgi:MinD superfamily P-loop ATPase